MKGKLKERSAVLVASLMIVAAAMIVSPVWIWGEEADAAVKYLPGVTEEMTDPSYWSSQMKEPGEVLADRDKLRAIQESFFNEKEIMMTDMSAWTKETYNGVEQNVKLTQIAEADAKYSYDTGHKYDDQGYPFSSWDEAKSQYYGQMINNCKDNNPQEEMPVKFAICTKRTALTIFPSDKPLHDDPGDPDYDFKYLARVRVNEPLVLQGVSGDGKYYAATGVNVSGWVPAEDIAICSDRQEWLNAWNFSDEETLVVIDDKIYTEDSNYDPQLSHVKLPMGTTLKLAAENEWSGRINNRSAYNNHVVWMPVRRENGTYDKKLALIGQNRKVSEGYLPMTSANLAKVAMNYLGDAYGWGGMMGTNDCSGYVNDVYKCFGLTLARNTTWQSMLPVKKYNLKGMTKEEKTEIIKKLPVGAVLIWPTHEMLYLGNKGDDLFVISSVSNLILDGNRTRIRGNVISRLDMSSAGGSDWLSNLTTANVPYLTPDSNLPERKQPDPPKPKPITPKVSGTPLANATAKKNGLTIGWNKIQGAEGYDVFFATCNRSGKKEIKCKKVKTIKGNKTFKWTKSGLKKGTAYKFYVRAYITKNGKKTYVSKTPMFHAYTGNGTKNYTSAKSVTIKNVKKGKLTLKKGKTFKIKAKVNKINKKKKLMPKSHAPTLRYMTSNKKIASVSSKGTIKAKAKGKCYIYAYAHNGVSKKVKVTVK